MIEKPRNLFFLYLYKVDSEYTNLNVLHRSFTSLIYNMTRHIYYVKLGGKKELNTKF